MFMSCRFPLQPRHVDGVLYVDFYSISTVNTAYFMYMVNKVFMKYLDKFVVVFINDILVLAFLSVTTKNRP